MAQNGNSSYSKGGLIQIQTKKTVIGTISDAVDGKSRKRHTANMLDLSC